MTVFEILLSVAAVAVSSGGVAYTLHVVRNTPRCDQSTEDEVRRVIESAPHGQFDNALDC